MGLINLDIFRKVSLNNDSFSQEIINRFLQQSQEYSSQLDASINDNDFRGVKSVMQQLKSQAQMFGADDLVGKIRKIERANSEKYDQHKEHVLETKSEFESLVKEVESMQSQA
jgi:HPt (histidine-containing phosphotransfer) domain-containing protein